MLWSASKSLRSGLDLQSEVKTDPRGKNNNKKIIIKKDTLQTFPELCFAPGSQCPSGCSSLHGLGGFAGSFNSANAWSFGGQGCISGLQR